MKNQARPQHYPSIGRSIGRMPRVAALLAAGAIAALAAPAGADAPAAGQATSQATSQAPGQTMDQAAGASHCQSLHGTFSVQALPDEDCDSPAGRCTVGRFTGVLSGDYEFTLESLIPSPVTNIYFYSGSSRIQLLRGGALAGIDSGTIDFDFARFGQFVSMLTVTGSGGAVDGATGQVVMRGELDFLGGGSGTYTGVLCPEE